MLILMRHTSESVTIHVGDVTVRVMVTDIGEDRCSLGFDAPPEVAILRSELEAYAPIRARRRHPGRH